MSTVTQMSHAQVLAHDVRIIRWLLAHHPRGIAWAHIHAQCWMTRQELLNLGFLAEKTLVRTESSASRLTPSSTLAIAGPSLP